MFDLVAHLDKSLSGAICFPSTKVFCFKPFPDDFYPTVLQNLPPNEFYTDLPHEDALREDGSSTRTVMDLNAPYAPTFWKDLHVVLCSTGVQELFREYIGFEGSVHAVARLFRDFSGYKINPHPDSSKKACTVQFYLPSDNSQVELGTSFYDQNGGTFDEIIKIPFLPNTGYAFKVTENSYHGANLPKFTKPRDTLILTYYKDKI